VGLAEIVRIEGVSIKEIPTKPNKYSVRAFIKNVGEEVAVVNSIYVVNLYGNVYCSDFLELKLNPGEVGSINLECELEKMTQYFVKVSTKKGYESVYSVSI